MSADTTPAPAPPRLLFWETTAACNLRCIHCRRLDVLERADPNQLTTAEAREMIDELGRMETRVLVFSGGEPLVREDLFDLARYAVERNLAPAVATNGTTVDEAVAKDLLAAGVLRVSVSLDGASAETHEALRGRGSFARALAGLEHLRRVGISTQVNATVTRKNRHELDDLYRLACDCGADAIHFFLLVPVGCGAEIPPDVRLDAMETEEVLERIADFLEEGRIFTKATCAPQFFRIVRARRLRPPVSSRHAGAMATLTKGCLAGTGIAFVSHTGEVFPCGYLPVSAGNLRTRSFGEIWKSSPVWKVFRADPLREDVLEGKCGVCSFRAVCLGCRARAWAAEGRLAGEDPDCAYAPGGEVRPARTRPGRVASTS